MKQSLLILGAMLTLGFPATINAEIVNVSTPNTSLILNAEKGGPLKILHYGDRLSATA